MTENEANIYSIAYRDCKEVANSIDVNEKYGKASTILFYMDEILEALKIASKLQEIGTVEEFKEQKEKVSEARWDGFVHSAYHGTDNYGEPIYRDVVVYHCSRCNRRTVIRENYCPSCGRKMKKEQKHE